MKRAFVIVLSAVTLAVTGFVIVQAASAGDKPAPVQHSPKGPSGYGLNKATAPKILQPTTPAPPPQQTTPVPAPNPPTPVPPAPPTEPQSLPGTRTLQVLITLPQVSTGCETPASMSLTIRDNYHNAIASGLLPAVPGTGGCQFSGSIPNVPYSPDTVLVWDDNGFVNGALVLQHAIPNNLLAISETASGGASTNAL